MCPTEHIIFVYFRVIFGIYNTAQNIRRLFVNKNDHESKRCQIQYTISIVWILNGHISCAGEFTKRDIHENS